MRKVLAGLPLGGEAVWPGLHNDLFVAHDSIYLFASRFANGRRVLDAACGTGYGSARLAAAGAISVVGLDLSRPRLRFARRRYLAPHLDFQLGDCESLDVLSETFDLVVSSNTLEHLQDPAAFLRGVDRCLAPGGQLLAAVPPVVSEADVEAHRVNEDHVSNLSVDAWAALFEAEGWSVRTFGHRCELPLDFGSFRRSRVRVEDFRFVEEPFAAFYQVPPITAIFVLQRAS